MAVLGCALAIALLESPPAWAGMPFYTLSEIARMRVEVISFFLAVLLLVTLFVKWLWSSLRRDLPQLPLLGFKRALAMVLLLSLSFYLVLVMIAGARELMTPGAWKKHGALYQVADQPALGSGESRGQRLERLRQGLWAYAAKHAGNLPANELSSGLPEDAWKTGPDGASYVYVAGQQAGRGNKPLVYEPGTVGRDRFVLRVKGTIEVMAIEEIRGALAGDTP